jgi:predicted aspartyl protease
MRTSTIRHKGTLARGEGVGRFAVEIALANNQDVALADAGVIGKSEIRRACISGWVDSGAGHLVLPQAVVDELGLPDDGTIGVRYADQRSAARQRVSNVYLEFEGRHGVFSAIVEPNRDTALIGAIVMEELDLVVDCSTQSLRPRDPDRIISEIE